MTNTGSERDDENYLDYTVKYEQVFLERSEQIQRALDASTSKDYIIRDTDIFNELETALSGAGETDDDDDDDELSQAFVGYLQLIMTRNSNAANLLSERGASDNFIKFVLNSIIEYGAELQRLNFRQTQGKNWWSYLETDRILDNGAIKHKHKLTLDKRREVEVDSVPYADWVLIRHFMNEFIESYYIADEDRFELVDKDELNKIRRSIYLLEEDLKNREVELPNRDKLLEEVRFPGEEE